MVVGRGLFWTLYVWFVVCACGAAGDALQVIEADLPDTRIATLVLTPAGTPWVFLETSTGQRNRYAYRLRCARETPTHPRAMVLETVYDHLRGDWEMPKHRVGSKTGLPFTYCVTGTTFSVSFCGGADRDAWALLEMAGQEEKRLLKLGDGGIEAVDTCRALIRGMQTSVYVARDGRLLNWGESYLAVRSTTGTWTRAEAVLPFNYKGLQPVIIERGDTLFVFESPMLYRIGPENTIIGTRIEGMPVGDHNVVAHVWGGTHIVVWFSGFPPVVSAFDIVTLQRIPAPFLPREWNVDQDRAFSTRDGSLWLSGREGDTPVTIQIPPGHQPPIRRPMIPFPDPMAEPLIGRTALECADGTVVSGQFGLTLTSLRGKVRRLGWREGFFGMSSDFQEAADGRLWFVNGGRALALNRFKQIGPFAGAVHWQECPLPESGTAGVRLDGASEPARTGGLFHYPGQREQCLNGGTPEREFGEHRIAVRLMSTPLFGMYVLGINEEVDGSATFLVCDGQEAMRLTREAANGDKGRKLLRHFRYVPPTGVGFSREPPATCGRTLNLPLAVPDAVRWHRVHLALINDGLWQRVEVCKQPVARFLFPSNGTYRCEVIAFDHGARVPGAAVFSVAAEVTAPDTQLIEPRDETRLLDVNTHPWFPPVRTLPSAEGGTRRLLWRGEEETSWHPVEPAAGLSVIELGRGERTVFFCAEEDEIWRDPSPMRVRIRVALPMEAYLEAIQQEMLSRVPEHRERALQALRACLPEARAKYDALKRLADKRERIAEGLKRIERSQSGGIR